MPFQFNETPSGTINGSNKTFTLSLIPSPSNSLQLYLNGLLQTQTVDYTLSSATITFTVAPLTGDTLLAFYVSGASPSATGLKLSDSINWARPFIGYLIPTIGTNNEPALTSANMTAQIICGAPFTWYWNRAVKTISITLVGGSDYTQTGWTDFGVLEKATVQVSGSRTYELPDVFNHQALGVSSDTARPNAVAVHTNDDAGNVVLRYMSAPDQTYSSVLTYQKLPPIFIAPSSTWAPIPDDFSFIFNSLFLSFLFDAMDEPQKAQIWRAKGIASLLARSEGLSDLDKQIFMAAYLDLDIYSQMRQLKTQQGIQARGSE